MFEISKIKNVDFSPKVLAVMDIYMPSVDFTLKEARLVQADSGMFVGVNRFKLEKPYQNKKTGEMVEYVAPGWFGKKFRDQLNEIAGNAYDPSMQVGTWYGEGVESYGDTPNPMAKSVKTALETLDNDLDF